MRHWAPVALLIAAMAGVGALGLGTVGPAHADKAVHALEFAALALMSTRALRLEAPGASGAAILAGVLLLCLGVGAADEAIQAWQPERVSDWRDLAADLVGAAAGALVGALIYRRN